jgi:hypothetical protein
MAAGQQPVASGAKRCHDVVRPATSAHRLLLAGSHVPAGKLQIAHSIFQMAPYLFYKICFLLGIVTQGRFQAGEEWLNAHHTPSITPSSRAVKVRHSEVARDRNWMPAGVIV